MNNNIMLRIILKKYNNMVEEAKFNKPLLGLSRESCNVYVAGQLEERGQEFVNRLLPFWHLRQCPHCRLFDNIKDFVTTRDSRKLVCFHCINKDPVEWLKYLYEENFSFNIPMPECFDEVWEDYLIEFKEWITGKKNPPTTVRWMDAYCIPKGGLKLNQISDFELNPGRWVSAEPFINGKSYIHHPKVGLLVDTSKSMLIRAYSSDANTPTEFYKGSSLAVSCFYACGDWESVDCLPVQTPIDRPDEPNHREALIHKPVYSAVVYREGGKEFAENLAAQMNLPAVPI